MASRKSLLTGLVAVVLVAVLAPAASPRAEAPAVEYTYRVVAATHLSSSKKVDQPFYTGSSSSTWKLAPATKAAPNVFSITIAGPIVMGAGTINVRGAFKAEATSNRPARCSLLASTGSRKYPAVAPGAFQLSAVADPKASSRILVVQGPGMNVHATLGNPYFPSECSTTISGEPDADDMTLKSLPRSAFGKASLVLRYSGTSSRDKIQYRWSTTFTLRRVAR